MSWDYRKFLFFIPPVFFNAAIPINRGHFKGARSIDTKLEQDMFFPDRLLA
jgi:hypothetical protein